MLSVHHQHSAATTSFNLRAETLLGQDQRICNSLEEKLQLYAELTDLTLNSPEAVPHRHLLVQPDTDSEVPKQASSLLTAALREGKKKMLLCGCAVGLCGCRGGVFFFDKYLLLLQRRT